MIKGLGFRAYLRMAKRKRRRNPLQSEGLGTIKGLVTTTQSQLSMGKEKEDGGKTSVMFSCSGESPFPLLCSTRGVQDPSSKEYTSYARFSSVVYSYA